MFDHKDDVSQRQVAGHFKISHSYVNKLLKTKTNVRKRKKLRFPQELNNKPLKIDQSVQRFI